MTTETRNGWTDEQRKIEGMYQRAMDLRDSTPGSLPRIAESRYINAYKHAFNQSHDVKFFRAMTRDYRHMLNRRISAERERINAGEWDEFPKRSESKHR